jgi:hypothetical protein
MPHEEVLRRVTASNGLCEQAEELFRGGSIPATWRCQFCPLFYSLGGRPADVGCRSLRDPLIEAIRQGNKDLARARAAGILTILEEIPASASQ